MDLSSLPSNLHGKDIRRVPNVSPETALAVARAETRLGSPSLGERRYRAVLLNPALGELTALGWLAGSLSSLLFSLEPLRFPLHQSNQRTSARTEGLSLDEEHRREHDAKFEPRR